MKLATWTLFVKQYTEFVSFCVLIEEEDPLENSYWDKFPRVLESMKPDISWSIDLKTSSSNRVNRLSAKDTSVEL